MQRDVIIAGGGIIGCSIALRLAQAGLKVTVIERNRVGSEASRAAAGMLAPQAEATGPGPFFDLCMRSRSIYSDFAAEIQELSGIDVEYRDEGLLLISFEGDDRSSVEGWTAWQLEAGMALEHMSADEARELEPAVTEMAVGAVLVPGDHQVENRLLMDGLEIAVRRAGVEVIEGRQVDSLAFAGGRAVGVNCGGELLGAGAVVVAAGCWSSQLLGPAGLDIEIIPARGQMIAVKGGRSPINHILHSSKCYLAPRRDGRVLIGATVEYAGYDKAVTVAGMRSLLAGAIEMAPSLAQFQVVESWSGLRPDTKDHLPVIGPTGVEGLVVATGHFRNGILLAPVTAEMVRKTIIDGRAPQGLRPFEVTRFGSPALAADG